MAAKEADRVDGQSTVSTYVDDFAEDEDNAAAGRPTKSRSLDDLPLGVRMSNELINQIDSAPPIPAIAPARMYSSVDTTIDGIVTTLDDGSPTAVLQANEISSVSGRNFNQEDGPTEFEKIAGGSGDSDGRKKHRDDAELGMLRSQVEAAR